MESNKKNSNKLNNHILLPIVLLLIILILASSAFLGAVLKGRAGNEENVIALFPGDKISSSAASVDYVPAKLKPGFKAYDNKLSWDTKTDVDLFKKAYENKYGEQTVKSNNSDKIIAPGTSNTYSFSLKNTGNVDFDYKMNLKSVFKLDSADLPILVRLYDGENWLAGNKDNFIPANKLNDIEVDGTLKVGKYITYTLEWEWQFENDDADLLILQNVNDTLAGNISANADTEFDLTINTTAEVQPNAVATDENGKPLYDKVDKNINIIYAGIPLILSLGALFGILLLLIFRRKIYVSGFVAGYTNYIFKYKKNEDTIRVDDRFVFAKVKSGKHTFTLCSQNGNKLADFEYKLKFKKNDSGLSFEKDNDITVITVSPKIKAIELFFDRNSDVLVVNSEKWSGIDKKHNVYTINNIIKPDDNKCNVTPYGLAVDEHNNLTFETKAKENENV